MNDRRTVLTILVIVFFVGLAAAIGMLAFRLGREAATTGQVDDQTTRVGETSPTAAPPPPVVTNTPTATPTPTPMPGPTATSTPTPSPSPTPSPTPIVVINRISALGRLETTEFAMRTVIDLENDPSNLWERIVGTDQLMLMAEGEVVAGFDLKQIEPADIAVQGTTVKITLPPAEILYSRIDNEQTYVYERRTGLLVKPDPTLESRARLLAEQSLVEWAEERGIYQKAEEAGRTYLENFLRSLGFDDITIEVRERDL